MVYKIIIYVYVSICTYIYIYTLYVCMRICIYQIHLLTLMHLHIDFLDLGQFQLLYHHLHVHLQLSIISHHYLPIYSSSILISFPDHRQISVDCHRWSRFTLEIVVGGESHPTLCYSVDISRPTLVHLALQDRNMVETSRFHCRGILKNSINPTNLWENQSN